MSTISIHLTRKKKQLFFLFAFACFLIFFTPRTASSETIRLKNGKIITGEVLKITPDYVYVKRTTKNGGDVRMKLDIDKVIPPAVYRLKTNYGNVDTPAEHFELGQFCLDNNLFGYARKQFKIASEQQANSSISKKAKESLKKVDTKEASHLYLQGMSAMDGKRYGAALNSFQKILNQFPNTTAAQKASARVKEITNLLSNQNRNARQNPQPNQKKNQQQNQKQANKILSEINVFVESGIQKVKVGLKREASGNYTSSFDLYEGSVAQFLTARLTIEKELGKPKWNNQKTVKARFKQLDQKTRNWLLLAYTNMAELYALRGNTHSALKWSNEALALDPHYDRARDVKLLIIKHRLDEASEYGSWND